VILVSPYDPRTVLQILEREVDRPPSLWRSVLTLNAHYFVGHAPVCGTIGDGRFELRSRRAPAFSLRANGTLRRADGGTEIAVTFSRPVIPGVAALLGPRYDLDREAIVAFLKQRLHAEESA
jgi:hypothetical protein